MEEIKKEFEDLITIKTFLKGAINEKGGTITDDTPFSEYPNQVKTKTGNLLDTLQITENGKHNVKDYKNVSVLVTDDNFEKLQKLISSEDEVVMEIPYGITKIAPNFLSDRKSNISFNSPELIEKIGTKAFGCQSKLGSIVPAYFENCTEIGDEAFRFVRTAPMTSYKGNIYLPKVKTIGKNAFYGGNNSSDFYEKFDLICPECTKLGDYAFSNRCTSRKRGVINVDLPECTEIGQSAFEDCAIGTFNAPKITMIKYALFNGTFGNDEDGTGISGEFICPENVTLVDSRAFRNNVFLTKFVCNNKCETIGVDVFYGCDRLETIILNEGLKTISNTFYDSASKIKSLEIPSTVTSIGSHLVPASNAENKITIVMKSETPPTIHSYTFNNLNNLDKIFVPNGRSSAYKSATNWSKVADYIVERNNVIVNVPTSLLNNENYTYSLDGGKTYNQFTSTTLPLENSTTSSVFCS